MKLKEILESVAPHELKYPVSISWLPGGRGGPWMHLVDTYYQDGKLIKDLDDRNLHDGNDDTAVWQALATEIKKHPMPADRHTGNWDKDHMRFELTVDDIHYSLVMMAPTVDGIMHGKAALE